MKNDRLRQQKILLEKLIEKERLRTSGEEASQRYLVIHKNRFQKTLEICNKLVPDSGARVLDVGPSYFTTLLAQKYKSVSTLGLDIMTDHGGHRHDSTLNLARPHVKYDLNESKNISSWPQVARPYDLVLFAETLEHLYTAPEYSLTFLGSLLTEKGILLVTTPNAAMIMKRFILLLKGKNPYEHIRLIEENPGHYREYTMKELIDIGTQCQLNPIYAEYINYYAPTNYFYGLLKRINSTFNDSFIIAFQKK
jgi:2-polyprenyl-3-methyl-5-hydroxy-6-metoxy-1,4-benzoquinol methylase